MATTVDSLLKFPYIAQGILGFITLKIKSWTEERLHLWGERNIHCIYVSFCYKITGFLPWGVSPSGENFVNPPHLSLVPIFGPRLAPQPRFVPKHLKNLNTFLYQI